MKYMNIVKLCGTSMSITTFLHTTLVHLPIICGLKGRAEEARRPETSKIFTICHLKKKMLTSETEDNCNISTWAGETVKEKQICAKWDT